MNKEKALGKLSKLMHIVQSLPDEAYIISIQANCDDAAHYNYVQLCSIGELPEFESSRQHGDYVDTVCHFSVVDGFEVFALKDKVGRCADG